MKNMKKSGGICYYTCNTHKIVIDDLCRTQLAKAQLPIVSVSLNKDVDFGDVQLRLQGERSPLTMHKQIVMALEASVADYVFLAESDVLYHPSHFDFTPLRDDVFYFNTNVWKMRWNDGHCIWTDNCQQLSGMCGSRTLLLTFFKKRLAEIEKDGFNRHYEPPESMRENYRSKVANICIRHDANITRSKWSINDYRNKKYAKGWKEADAVPGWDITKFFGV